MIRAPRRFNTYVGAARAAMAAGETDVAHDYYQKLLELAAEASTRPELEEEGTRQRSRLSAAKRVLSRTNTDYRQLACSGRGSVLNP